MGKVKVNGSRIALVFSANIRRGERENKRSVKQERISRLRAVARRARRFLIEDRHKVLERRRKVAEGRQEILKIFGPDFFDSED